MTYDSQHLYQGPGNRPLNASVMKDKLMSLTVDFHTHTFPDQVAPQALDKLMRASHTRPFSDGTAGGLRKNMLSTGIDRCVVLPVATGARQVPHINDAALRANEASGQTGLYSLGAMHPDFDGWHDELGRLAAHGVRGVKLHPPYQNADIDDPRFLRILTRAGELGLFAVIHAGLDVGLPGSVRAVPAKIAAALRQAGPVRLVCAHMGGWRCWDEAADLLAPLGVWIDSAFSLGRLTPLGDGFPWDEENLNMLGQDGFLRLVRAFGADRVLFGTDSPWADQREELARIRALPMPEKERAAILGGNAARLMGWTDVLQTEDG